MANIQKGIDAEEQKEALGTGEETKEDESAPTKPDIKVYVTSDRMEVTVEILHTSVNTLNPVFGDIMEAIAAAGVTWGVNRISVGKLCNPARFNDPVVVAQGKPAATGADGYLVFTVETERNLKPKENTDGTVDFRDLGFVQTVRAGQTLCEIHAPEKGADGMDVFGNVLEGRFGKEPSNPAGKNTTLNEDETLLLAACDGSVEVKNGVATVLEQLKINGNIDNSTGDIRFPGDILIGGDVISGFNVSSENGNIIIKGNVEGATVEAAGDITVHGGINGMERGAVRAGGDLKCKFIQSCFVKSGGNIYAEAVMYCVVECGGNMEMGGDKSRLIAGRCTVAGYIKVSGIGTSSHIPTIVIINSGAELDKEIRELEAKIKDMDDQQVKLQQLFARFEDLRQKNRLTPDMLPTLEMARNNYTQLQQTRTETADRVSQAKGELLELQTNAQNSYIQCRGPIHTGVTITFGPLTMPIQQSIVNTRIGLVSGDIKIMNL